MQFLGVDGRNSSKIPPVFVETGHKNEELISVKLVLKK